MKRFLDLAVSLSAILLLSPLLLILAVLIAMDLGRPVFFKQKRAGQNGDPFNMLKFRTMTNATNEYGDPLPDSERLTKIGKFLRSTSLDELPELFNVAIGNMSLVGPRPLLLDYLPLYTKQQYRRHEVKPGITGWAQINGRNLIAWEKKFELDVWYVDNQTLALDLLILLKTVKKIFVREGINTADDSVMPRFTGSTEEK